MDYFRKKPVIVTAVRFDGDNYDEVKTFTDPGNFRSVDDDLRRVAPGIVAEAWDRMHSTWVGVWVGDWIIRGVRGETYPCADDVFTATYERWTDPSDPSDPS